MLSPYRINPNNKKTTKKTKIDNIGDLKRPKMPSNDLKTTSIDNNKNLKTKNNSKARSIQNNIEINEHYLDTILKNNNT